MVLGLTVMLEPLPIEVPPQLPLYHFHVAPVPRLPPLTVRVEDEPGQKLSALLLM